MNVMNDTSDEPLRAIDFASTDALLRDDVKMLGALVGEILAEQRGDGFLDDVERLRRAAIRRREAQAPIAALADALADIDLDQASDLVRAFATYFQAVNLAERVHRIRRRRDYERRGADPQPGGLRDAIATLARLGVSAEEVAALLPRLRIEPVFTAHPTEAVRRALLEKERTIVGCLVADIDRARTPPERRADRERIRLALTASWQTAEAPAAKPSVADEFEHVGFYLSDVLYRVLPVYYEMFEEALGETYGSAAALPDVLGFGTWVGGDMDGNPNVGADTIAAGGRLSLPTAEGRRAAQAASCRHAVSQPARADGRAPAGDQRRKRAWVSRRRRVPGRHRADRAQSGREPGRTRRRFRGAASAPSRGMLRLPSGQPRPAPGLGHARRRARRAAGSAAVGTHGRGRARRAPARVARRRGAAGARPPRPPPPPPRSRGCVRVTASARSVRTSSA
jgi:hypothetical protein